MERQQLCRERATWREGRSKASKGEEMVIINSQRVPIRSLLFAKNALASRSETRGNVARRRGRGRRPKVGAAARLQR
eukprot:6190947-Pleurochrysis_carterae.AAC.2